MTEKQVDRVKATIAKYKKALADDKKYWGGDYHDGQGIRYMIPGKYVQIADYKGGLRYLNWFKKNLPEDFGDPLFLFESALIFFKCNRLKDAELKVHHTFFSNTYLLDFFLEKEPLQPEKHDESRWQFEAAAKHLPYKKSQPELMDFAQFVEEVLQSRQFLDKANEYTSIQQQIEDKPVGKVRDALLERSYKIKYG